MGISVDFRGLGPRRLDMAAACCMEELGLCVYALRSFFECLALHPCCCIHLAELA